jgi:hypothetical protein
MRAGQRVVLVVEDDDLIRMDVVGEFSTCSTQRAARMP